MEMKRRDFVHKSSILTLGINAIGLPNLKDPSKGIGKADKMNGNAVDEKSYLSNILYTKEEVDDWFAGKAFPFSKYDSELGWLLPDAKFRDGINNSVSIYTYARNDGERLMSNYKDETCRINTYGNSFTQCHQVSDHETWQEILAAHLQEPVRNFGIGGWSVYQAYLRMLREERHKPAEYIIFNIYEDDHKRNLDSWRNIRVRKHPQHIEATLPYLKVNLEDKTVIECKNPCQTPASYYDLCDLDKTYHLFKNDFVLKIMVAHENSTERTKADGYEYLSELIKTHGIKTNIDENETLSESAEKVHWQAALFSTEKVIDKIEKFAVDNHKKVLYILSYPGKSIARFIEKQFRQDQQIVDYLKKKNLPFIDLLEIHEKDFKSHNLEMNRYIDKYFIGHYNPRGNFFCAYALKDKLIALLEPKPLPYRQDTI